MTYLTIEHAKTELERAQADAETANQNVTDVQAKLDEAWKTVNNLHHTRTELQTISGEKEGIVHIAKTRVSIAEANEKADDRCTRSELIEAVEMAVNTRMPYAADALTYGELIVKALEWAQRNNGLPTALARNPMHAIETRVINLRSFVVKKAITPAQMDRAMETLTRLCPKRSEHTLGVPYKLAIDDDGCIVTD